MRKIAYYLIGVVATFPVYGTLQRPQSAEREFRGNLAHKITPVTTFGFGQNIVNKNNLFFYPYLYYYTGKNTHQLQIVPGILYGITNWLSLYISLPIIPTQKINQQKSYGITDLTIQMEYAFYHKSSLTAEDQITIVANVAPPTTHLSTSCDLSCTTTSIADSTNLFLGFTASHLSINWYTYIAGGITVYTKKECTQYGNIWYYQGGIGHYVGGTKRCTIAGVLELNGTYAYRNSAFGQSITNSGGNSFFIGPSLSICADWWQLQGGVQFPALQKLHGTQQKQNLRIASSLTVLF